MTPPGKCFFTPECVVPSNEFSRAKANRQAAIDRLRFPIGDGGDRSAGTGTWGAVAIARGVSVSRDKSAIVEGNTQ